MAEDALRAIIIDSPWIGMILDGLKTWEMRSKVARRRGLIGLIQAGSGQVVGTACLVDCLGPLHQNVLAANRDRHQIPLKLATGRFERYNYAWVLQDARRLPHPVRYQHKSGSVIWVKLSPEVSRLITAQS